MSTVDSTSDVTKPDNGIVENAENDSVNEDLSKSAEENDEVYFKLDSMNSSGSSAASREVYSELAPQHNPIVEAVPTVEHDHLQSDDDAPKILTTLEPAKKKTVKDGQHEEYVEEDETTEIDHSLENDEMGEEMIEVYTSDGKEYIMDLNDDYIVEEEVISDELEPKMMESLQIIRVDKITPGKSRPNVSEIAQMQLANLTRKKGRPKKSNEDKQIQIIESRIVSPPKCHNKSPIAMLNKQAAPPLIRNKTPIITNQVISLPIISKKPGSSRSFNQPIILNKDAKTNLARQIQNRFKVTLDEKSKPVEETTSKKSAADELLELLEGAGDDNMPYSHIETNDNADYTVHDIKEAVGYSTSKKSLTDKDREIQLAMEQMMNLPRYPKGRRPKKRPSVANTVTVLPIETIKNRELVDSLVNDWSDSESKDESEEPLEKSKIGHPDAKKTYNENVATKMEKMVQIIPPHKIKVEESQPSFKRTRIIKKKIIWDPDAPETQISYASRIQNSSTNDTPKKIPQGVTVKKIIGKKSLEALKNPKEEEPEGKSTPAAGTKRPMTATPQTSTKKRIKSEIDKLLGDEGAANMLQSLEPSSSSAGKVKVLKQSSIKASFSPVTKSTSEVAKVARGKKTGTSKVSPPKGVGTGKKKYNASGQWDYVYAERNEDAMIIRRRSNSSYSSTTSPRRLSMDIAEMKDLNDEEHQDDQFKFAKPPVKRASRDNSAARDHSIVADIKGKFNKALTNGTVRRSSRAHLTPELPSHPPVKTIKVEKEDVVEGGETKKTVHNELSVKTFSNFVVITFASQSTKLKNSFTLGMMNELTALLSALKNDESCRVVALTGHDGFCSGIDFSVLVQATEMKRSQAAEDMSNAIFKLLECLIYFKKPIIAGVNGLCAGLGLMILPLFDIVLASSASQFEASYAKIGQHPEGMHIIKASGKIHPKALADLFFLGETYHTAKALEYGLVSKIATGMEPFEGSLQKVAEKVASFSSQSLESMKCTLRNVQILSDGRLEEELKLCRQHWSSTECQEYFKGVLLSNKKMNNKKL